MKQIEEFIKSNKEWKAREEEELKNNNLSDYDKDRIKQHILILEYYVKGLEDAKKYIEEESK